MFPNILMFHPEAARALLEYRIRTLGGALENAQNLGYQVRGPGHWPAAPCSLHSPPSLYPSPRAPLWTELRCPGFSTLRIEGPQQGWDPALAQDPLGYPCALPPDQHMVKTGQKEKNSQQYAVSGLEVCPEDIYGAQEVHVNGAVVLAFELYYQATQVRRGVPTIPASVARQLTGRWE
ncbi:hypothetical protein P7K49_040278 [Saguinus oedipus]|uniref:Uncharacterized protein n=1 Tax=Saguinus oedipus TaxID=9490 RepID=A0ABQ9T8V0_SAGOE|nr:hypothetical protein P7K49_040278 [Saguinus oedipus]